VSSVGYILKYRLHFWNIFINTLIHNNKQKGGIKITIYCPNCGEPLVDNSKFCTSCGTKIDQQPTTITQQQNLATQTQQIPVGSGSGIWNQNYYKIRKKVMTVGNKYWIEDYNGNLLGFCKQKLFKLKEDIRIYTDESLTNELFSIKQEQIMDMWGKFGVFDSASGMRLGYIQRNFLSEFGRDAWEIYDNNNQLIGRIFEKSLGRALARKYLPGGALVPEKMTLELNGQPVAEINQDFKIIGDIWEMNCFQIPPQFDRRVLLSTMLLMGSIERSRK
jgi:uncharacterized protein YxjI